MMKDLGRIIAHIPARSGSKRVKSKNLRYIAGQPLILYSINAALGCPYLKEIYVNTDSLILLRLAEKAGVPFYKRKKSLCNDKTQSDEFNMDIINSLNPDTLVMINPVCPLINSKDITDAIDVYRASDADTLITTNTTNMQTFYKNKAVNIDLNAKLSPSQANEPIHVCNWAITIWDAHKFKERYIKEGYAVFGENRILYPIDTFKSIKISTENDFNLVENILEAQKIKNIENKEIKYWS